MSLTGSGLFAVQAVLLQSSLWGEHPGHPVSQLHLPTQLKVLPGTMSCPVHNSDILGRAPWLATQTLNSEYSTKQWNLDMKLDLKKNYTYAFLRDRPLDIHYPRKDFMRDILVIIIIVDWFRYLHITYYVAEYAQADTVPADSLGQWAARHLSGGWEI